MLCVETMNMVPWMTTRWNTKHVCASHGTYSHDMLMKCMYMANNGVIVMNLLLYTRKGEGKGRK